MPMDIDKDILDPLNKILSNNFVPTDKVVHPMLPVRYRVSQAAFEAGLDIQQYLACHMGEEIVSDFYKHESVKDIPIYTMGSTDVRAFVRGKRGQLAAWMADQGTI
jgi:hypothetical protein